MILADIHSITTSHSVGTFRILSWFVVKNSSWWSKRTWAQSHFHCNSLLSKGLRWREKKLYIPADFDRNKINLAVLPVNEHYLGLKITQIGNNMHKGNSMIPNNHGLWEVQCRESHFSYLCARWIFLKRSWNGSLSYIN